MHTGAAAEHSPATHLNVNHVLGLVRREESLRLVSLQWADATRRGMQICASELVRKQQAVELRCRARAVCGAFCTSSCAMIETRNSVASGQRFARLIPCSSAYIRPASVNASDETPQPSWELPWSHAHRAARNDASARAAEYVITCRIGPSSLLSTGKD